VRVNPGVNDLAKKRGVEIRLYTIIYELLEDITDALAGKLEPERRDKVIGEARILQIFELSKGPKVCGCRVESGIVRVGAKARVRRDKELIYNGEVVSLRHFRDDVHEVKAGLECGIRLDNFADFIEGDEIEIYEVELKKAYDDVETVEFKKKSEWFQEKFKFRHCGNVEFTEENGVYKKTTKVHHYRDFTYVPSRFKALYRLRDWLSYIVVKCDTEEWHGRKAVIAEHMAAIATEYVKKAEADCYDICEHCGRHIGDELLPRC